MHQPHLGVGSHITHRVALGRCQPLQNVRNTSSLVPFQASTIPCVLENSQVWKTPVLEVSPKCLLGMTEGPAKATRKHRAQHHYAFATRTSSACDFSPYCTLSLMPGGRESLSCFPVLSELTSHSRGDQPPLPPQVRKEVDRNHLQTLFPDFSVVPLPLTTSAVGSGWHQ